MTSRELVRRTIEFDHPTRVPRQAWIGPWAEAHHPGAVARLRREFPDDIVVAPAACRTPPPVSGSPCASGTYVDEWGCRFHNAVDGVLGIVREPLIRDWSELAAFRTPDAVLAVDADAVNAFCRSTDRFVLAGALIRPFERLGFIRTFRQSLIDVLEQPPGFAALLQRIHEHYQREVEAWARTDVDAIVILDDWGTQTGPMVHPRLFRQIFLPLYRDYAALARRHGKSVFMHADGHILDILDDLIGAGIQAINCQTACMGVEELGSRFRGRVTFWGEIDRHLLATPGALASVARAAREFRERLGAGGGVIAQCEFGPGALPEHVRQVFVTFAELNGSVGAARPG